MAKMTRDPDRIPAILALLQDAWETNPDARFFQLLYNVVQADDSLSELYNVEDWQIADLLSRYLEDRKK